MNPQKKHVVTDLGAESALFENGCGDKTQQLVQNYYQSITDTEMGEEHAQRIFESKESAGRRFRITNKSNGN